MIETTTKTSTAAEVILLPSDRFFIRAVSLASGTDVDAQVALALESLAPFPVEQLFYGYLVSAKGDSAVVYAAYRKRFPAPEIVEWPDAAVVLPGFLALLGSPPSKAAIRIWSEPRGLTAMAWDGNGSQPVVVLARETENSADAPERLALVDEIRIRTGLKDALVQEFSGSAAGSHNPARENFALTLGDGGAGLVLPLSRSQADRADVRDKGFLVGQRSALRRDLLMWRGFLGCVIGLVALLVLELVVFGGNFWLKGIRGKLQEHAADVQKIETAQTLSTRIEELTQRRLMPLEMTALANENRPASIQFSHVQSTGLFSLEIQAQTPNAGDVGQYESVLRASPNVESVETHDLRVRNELTNFTLTISFKPSALQQGGGS